MAMAEVLTFTGVGGAPNVALAHREADLTGYASNAYHGKLWSSFALAAEGNWQKNAIPGYRGVDVKDFRPGPIQIEVQGYIVAEGASMGLTTRYTNLQSHRNDILAMVRNTYNVTSGPFTAASATNGSIIVDMVRFEHFAGEGGRQNFTVSATLITGSMT